MKYLVFGSNGMAGHIIAQYLTEKGHEVTGFAKTDSKCCNNILGNALNKEEVKKAINSDHYDYIINGIGVLNKFVDANPSDGIYLNSVFPHFLADCIKDSDTKLIHISTDCVFEGTKGCYTEQDIPDATSYYGRSKALGEVVDDKNLTIRTSIIGPELKQNGIGLFHWFMNQTGRVEGYEKVIWSGVTTLQLAKSIEEVAKKPVTGLYHLVNNQTISKYELLGLFQKYCRKQEIVILKNKDVISDKSLKNTKEECLFFIPGYEEMILDMGNWIEEHRELYRQYEGA